MRVLLALVLGLVWVSAGASTAAVICVDSGFGYESCVINNGLAPPEPENVIDDETYTEDQRVYVRNVGCPTDWGDPWVRGDDPCVSPGEPTQVELADGGRVDRLRVRDSSTVEMSGGTVAWGLSAYGFSSATLSGGWALDSYAYDSSALALRDGFATRDVFADDFSIVTMAGGEVQGDLQAQGASEVTLSGGTVSGYVLSSDSSKVTLNGGWVAELSPAGSSAVTMSGGRVRGQLVAYESATVTMSGGTLLGALHAAYSSVITIEGSDFAVDGAPVPYGDLAAETGTLTGTLASGDSLDNFFYQGQEGSPFYSGTITLVEKIPEPAEAALHACALLALALLRKRQVFAPPSPATGGGQEREAT